MQPLVIVLSRVPAGEREVYSLQHIMDCVISFSFKPMSVFLITEVTGITFFDGELIGPRELIYIQEQFDCPLYPVKKLELIYMCTCFFCAFFGQMKNGLEINSMYLSFRYRLSFCKLTFKGTKEALKLNDDYAKSISDTLDDSIK